MSYKEFKKTSEPKGYTNELYTIVCKDSRQHGLRGCNRDSVHSFVELVGADNVKIYRY